MTLINTPIRVLTGSVRSNSFLTTKLILCISSRSCCFLPVVLSPLMMLSVQVQAHIDFMVVLAHVLPNHPFARRSLARALCGRIVAGYLSRSCHTMVKFRHCFIQNVHFRKQLFTKISMQSLHESLQRRRTKSTLLFLKLQLQGYYPFLVVHVTTLL